MSNVEPQHRSYLIAAALVRRNGQILLVEQRGSDDRTTSWALPGGVVKAGELLPEALARELREETGIQVRQPLQLLYVAQLDRPRKNDQWAAFIFEVIKWKGKISVADPDDFVVGADVFSVDEAVSRLRRLRWRVMQEPIVAYLRGTAKAGTMWFYRQGDGGGEELVKFAGGTVCSP